MSWSGMPRGIGERKKPPQRYQGTLLQQTWFNMASWEMWVLKRKVWHSTLSEGEPTLSALLIREDCKSKIKGPKVTDFWSWNQGISVRWHKRHMGLFSLQHVLKGSEFWYLNSSTHFSLLGIWTKRTYGQRIVGKWETKLSWKTQPWFRDLRLSALYRRHGFLSVLHSHPPTGEDRVKKILLHGFKRRNKSCGVWILAFKTLESH